MLKNKQSVLTEDPEQCAEMLNVFFHSQFQTDYMACDFPKIEVSRKENAEITIAGVAKLISELPNRKSPGPDGIRKPSMLIDLACTAKCLSML